MSTSTEKIVYLPKELSTAGAPPGVNPAVGDITEIESLHPGEAIRLTASRRWK